MRILLVLVAIILLVGVVSADTVIFTTQQAEGIYRVATAESVLTLRNGNGNTIYSGSENTWGSLQSSATGTLFRQNARSFNSFNMSIVPVGSTITSGGLSLVTTSQYSQLGTGGLNYTLINATPANPFSLVKEDYQTIKWNILSTENLTHAAIASYANFTLNPSGILYLQNNIGGNVTLVVVTTWDYNGVFTGTYVNGSKLSGSRFATHLNPGGSSFYPYLTIGYTPPPDTTPPASITGLANTTTCNSINWSWANPTDVDYNGLMVWKNDTFLHNLSAATTNDLWLNLTELTSYTFSSKTFDATNNINATFVNRTSITSKCPPGPLASFASNVTCGLVPFRVQFNDTSYSSTNLTGWNWSFGDGNYSITQNPVFEYNLSGMFTVSLNVTNVWGSNISQVSNYIRGVPNWASCPSTPTPVPTWQPEINPSTEMDLQPNWWWLIAGGMILFIWLIFRRSR
jgi:PKD repeat protein